jgi:hypothetical protein
MSALLLCIHAGVEGIISPAHIACSQRAQQNINEVAEVFCSRCGKETAGDATFCSGCGVRIGEQPGGISAQTMSTRFGLVFWGLLLVILDFNINGIDILPDVVGYILVAIGCAGLSSVSHRFSTASVLSCILAALALIAYILRGSIATGLEYVSLAVDIAMIWFLLGGVMELATARQRMDLSERASQYRIVYTVLMCLATLAGVVGGPAVVMGIVVVICMLTLLILILHLLYRAKHELTGDFAV